MKPVNLNTAPCSPVSSNCVIWQGPNIPCINLCNGDTVSDVVFALATELCGVLDTLDVANYDLSCFGITACGPNDFQALIQFLIAQICALQGITPIEDKTGSTGCPDCLVTVAPCFVVGNQTTMNLTDYVNMIAAKICSIIDQLAIINATLTSLDIRVTTLENAPIPTFTIPSYTIGCDIGTLNENTSYQIDEILEVFTNDVWCPFYTATGTTSDILAAVASECISGGDPSRANPGVAINVAYPTWVNASLTLADTINNIWIALCDLYAASIAVEDTNTVNLTYTAGLLTANIQDTGWVYLNGISDSVNGYYGTATISQAYKPQCRRIGNVVHFRGMLMIPLSDGSGNALEWNYSNTTDSYYGVNRPDVATVGVGGCDVTVDGRIVFNQGVSVIPTSIMGAGETFDNGYSLGWRSAIRSIPIAEGVSGLLTTVIIVNINTNKTLEIGTISNSEQSVLTPASVAGMNSSAINNIISHVRENEFVPDYNNIVSTINSSPNSGSTHAVILPIPLAPDTQYVNNLSQYYNPAHTYPFDCNANDPFQIGGMFLRIDGLTAYINPCTGSIVPSQVC